MANTCTLREWLATHETELSGDDYEFAAECMDSNGWCADHPTADWRLWIGIDDNFVVENTIQGTNVDHVGRYVVTSWPHHVEIRQSDSGMSGEEVSLYIAQMPDCEQVVLRINDE